MPSREPSTPSTAGRSEQPTTGGRRRPRSCRWCGRRIAEPNTVGRRRQYCGQSCRQRAYESRAALAGTGVAPDSVILTPEERELLADKLFQVRCAAEDVATALAEQASRAELRALVSELLARAESAETLH